MVRPNPVRTALDALGRVVFVRFWTTLALQTTIAEWILWCWWMGPPQRVWVHFVTLTALFAANRVACEAFEQERHRAPLQHWVGGTVLAVGTVMTASAVALTVMAAGWSLVDMLVALPAQAGAIETPSGGHLGPGFRLVAMPAIVITTVAMAYGYVFGHRQLTVTRLDVPVPGLPAALDGLRILHLSDLHLGPLADRAGLRDAIARANALDADLICVTGDVVDSPRADLDAWLPELAALRARHGVYAILGNHDLRLPPAEVAAAIERAAGWHVLRDDLATVRIGDASLYLLGLEDRPVAHGPGPIDALLARVPAGETALAMIHQPGHFPNVATTGIPLVLAGHTHGGQLAVPGMPRLNVARVLMTRFDAGTFVQGRSTLHVNRGLGVSGQRVRVGAPREITVVTLASAPAALAA